MSWTLPWGKGWTKPWNESFSVGGEGFGSSVFVSTWKTNNAGTSTNTQITIPVYNGGTYNCTVDWGDGSVSVITTYNDAAWTHTYAIAGNYTVGITGTFTGFRFNNGGDKLKLLNISQWGSFKFGNVNGYFYGASNLTISATDTPNMTGTTTFLNAFNGASAITQVPRIGSWDMTAVTDATSMFNGVTLTTENYDSLLIGWAAQVVQNSVAFHGGSSLYSVGAATTARGVLTGTYVWTITDGGQFITPVQLTNDSGVDLTSDVNIDLTTG